MVAGQALDTARLGATSSIVDNRREDGRGSMGPADTASVALVTGGANGLGRAVVPRPSSRPAPGSASSTSHPDALAGPTSPSFVGDVAEEGVVDAALAALEERWGPVSVLVNDAADYPNAGLLEMTPDAWRHVFDVNVTGMFLACRAFVAALPRRRPHLRADRQHLHRLGRAARGRAARRTPSSKAAVETISATLAMELGPLGHHQQRRVPRLHRRPRLQRGQPGPGQRRPARRADRLHPDRARRAGPPTSPTPSASSACPRATT